MGMQVNPRVTSVIAAGVLLAAGTVAAHFEGYVPHGYSDVVGVVSACRGHTGADVKLGEKYTPEQCEAWFREDLLKAAKGVQRCVATPMTPNAFAAYTSTAYNIGIAAFCRSSIARKANAGDHTGSCKAILLYVYAGGKRLRGLELRRQAEYALCVKD